MLELKPNSPELAAEIDMKETKINGTDAKIVFLNGSYIKVVTASDSSRGNRANVLILDEFRLISKDVIDTILRKFLTQRRMPKYEELTKAERRAEYDKEKEHDRVPELCVLLRPLELYKVPGYIQGHAG